MSRMRNIVMGDYQESVTTGQTQEQTDPQQSDPFVPICFAGDTKSSYLSISATPTSIATYLATCRYSTVFSPSTVIRGLQLFIATPRPNTFR